MEETDAIVSETEALLDKIQTTLRRINKITEERQKRTEELASRFMLADVLADIEELVAPPNREADNYLTTHYMEAEEWSSRCPQYHKIRRPDAMWEVDIDTLERLHRCWMVRCGCHDLTPPWCWEDYDRIMRQYSPYAEDAIALRKFLHRTREEMKSKTYMPVIY